MADKPISLQKLVNADKDADTLEQVTSADKYTTIVSRLGRQYPSLAKALQTIIDAGGFKPYSTEAELKASVPVIVPSAAYAFDTKKVWLWNGSAWIDEGTSALDQAKLDSSIKTNLLARDEVSKLDNYAFVIADEENNVGLGLNKDNSLDVAGASLQQTDKQADLVWGVADEDGNVSIGAMATGSALVAGQMHEQSNVSAIVDELGNVTNVLKDGDLYQKVIYSEQIYADAVTQKITSCYEENGNIFVVHAGEITQITFDGLNKNPVFASNRVIFLSKKQRNTYKQYQYKDGVISRYYPNADFAKYRQIVGTGQSLMLGVELLALDHDALKGAYKIGGHNVIARHDNANKGDIELLSEGLYQTISTGFAKQLDQAGTLMSGCARGGTLYADCKKGAQYGIFESCIAQVDLVHQKDKNSDVPAIIVIHGEADGSASNTVYDQNLRQWLDDFNTDIRAKIGHSSAVMLTCQTSSASGYKTLATRDQFTTPFLQLKASNNNPDIFLVGPKYQYAYKDYAHIQAADTRHLGEMYAKVYRKVCIEGVDWKPLQPTNFVVSGNQIVIDFYVPVAPLQFDTSIITSIANQGFELTNSGSVTITNVQITSATQVIITCSANVPNNAVLSYAFYNGTTASISGRVAGSRGTLKDSDNTQDKYGYMPLNNWCVTFKQTLTV